MVYDLKWKTKHYHYTAFADVSNLPQTHTHSCGWHSISIEAIIPNGNSFSGAQEVQFIFEFNSSVAIILFEHCSINFYQIFYFIVTWLELYPSIPIKLLCLIQIDQ